MLKKKLFGVGMAAALTFGFGFADKADAGTGSPPPYYSAYPYVGKDGHVYVNYDAYYGVSWEAAGVYKMYNLEKGIITAVNVYDDTDIIQIPDMSYPPSFEGPTNPLYENQGLITVHFSEKNNNDYKVKSATKYNTLILDGINHIVRPFKDKFYYISVLPNDQYDVHTYKVTWTDDNYVYLYTKNHPNPHEIKLPREGFEFLTAGDWLWAKVSEETWEWVKYGEITSNGLKIVE